MKGSKLLSRVILVLPLAIVTLHPAIVIAQTTAPKLSPAGCLSGDRNGTYQGDRPITRYEFAAGMNACLDQVNQQLQFNKARFATRTDLDTLIQQQRELDEQLRELSDRVDTISGDTAPKN